MESFIMSGAEYISMLSFVSAKRKWTLPFTLFDVAFTNILDTIKEAYIILWFYDILLSGLFSLQMNISLVDIKTIVNALNT
jgi:hypothetical protein